MTYGNLIASQTVGSGGAASITFSSISSTYTDLVIVYCGAAGASLILNGVTTGSVYSRRYLAGSGSSASSGNVTAANAFDAVWSYWGSETSMFGAVYIPNYSGSSNKRIYADTCSEINTSGASVQTQFYTGVFNNSSPITSVTISGLGTIPQYSTAYLYGLTKGTGGATVS